MVSRRLLLGSPVALVAGSAVAQQSGIKAAGGQLLDGRPLRVAVPNFNSRPFFYAENGALAGVDIALSRNLASALGGDVAFDQTPATFDEAVDKVARGDADVAICKLSRTLVRARSIRYSRPYVQLNHGMLVNRARLAATASGGEMERAIRGFEGSLGVIAGSSFAGFAAKSFPKARLVAFQSWPETVDAVRNGTVDAAYRDDFEIKKLFLDDPSLAVIARSVTLTDRTDTLAIGMHPDAQRLADFVNLYLELSHFDQPMTGDTVITRYYDKTN